jgi:hypothetical protein
MENEEFENGEWRMENEEFENGEWRMENGELNQIQIYLNSEYFIT